MPVTPARRPAGGHPRAAGDSGASGPAAGTKSPADPKVSKARSSSAPPSLRRPTKAPSDGAPSPRVGQVEQRDGLPNSRPSTPKAVGTAVPRRPTLAVGLAGEVRRLAQNVSCGAVVGADLWVGLRSGAVQVIAGDGTLLRHIRPPVAGGHPVRCLGVVADSVWVGCADHALLVVDATSGLARRARAGTAAEPACLAASRKVRGVEATPAPHVEECLVFVGCVDGSVEQWDGALLKCLNILTAHAGPVRHLLACEATGLWSAGEDAVIRCWDPMSLTCRAHLTGHFDAVTSLVLVTGPRPVLWSASEDLTLSLWNVADGQRLKVLHSDEPLHCLKQVGPLVYGAGPKSWLVWHAGTQERVGTLPIPVALTGRLIHAEPTHLWRTIWQKEDGTVLETMLPVPALPEPAVVPSPADGPPLASTASVAAPEEDVSQLREQLTKTQNDLAAMKEERDALQRGKMAVADQVYGLLQQLEDGQALQAANQEEVDKLLRALDESTLECVTLKEQLAAAEAKLQAAEEGAAAQGEHLGRSQGEVAALQRRLVAAEEEARRARQAAADAEKACQALRDDSPLQAEVAALQRQVAELEAAKASLPSARHQEFILQSRSKFVSNVHQLVSGLQLASSLARKIPGSLHRYVEGALRSSAAKLPRSFSGAEPAARSPCAAPRSPTLWRSGKRPAAPNPVVEEAWEGCVESNLELFQLVEMLQGLAGRGQLLLDAFLTASEKRVNGVAGKPRPAEPAPPQRTELAPLIPVPPPRAPPVRQPATADGEDVLPARLQFSDLD